MSASYTIYASPGDSESTRAVLSLPHIGGKLTLLKVNVEYFQGMVYPAQLEEVKNSNIYSVVSKWDGLDQKDMYLHIIYQVYLLSDNFEAYEGANV